jgi:hypothetical protein
LQGLSRKGWLTPYAERIGVIRWTTSGKECASIVFQSNLDEEGGYLQLHWTSSGRTGESRQCEAHIALTTKPQPLGGRRWYFVCPLTGANVTKLHKPVGASTFGSRSAYNLGYRSQRQSPRDRSISRAFALREKIGDKGAIGDYIPKPKGMHWRTFGRALERVKGAEEIVEAHAERLLRGSP